jgi:putative hydrolase of the HAD superfamily
MNLFTTRFYSFMLGVRKPEPRIYELALADAQIAPARALFVDDRAENIEGAARVGMQTLHVPTPQILQRELSKLFPLLDTRARANSIL